MRTIIFINANVSVNFIENILSIVSVLMDIQEDYFPGGKNPLKNTKKH